MKKLLSLLATSILVLATHAQTSPYAGDSTRAIKALSEGDIARLSSGHGMGLARAAELNSYPGPRHVLDMADRLELTETQAAELNRVVDAMKSAALPLGRDVIDREKELDQLFTSKQATAEAVLQLTREIGRLQGERRAVHLNAHVATVAILNAGQISRYNELRGCDSPESAASPAPHRH
ncbi:MAG TPA: Spy/CpxP family protein refolding chaperone [Opitutaceae bacterium]